MPYNDFTHPLWDALWWGERVYLTAGNLFISALANVFISPQANQMFSAIRINPATGFENLTANYFLLLSPGGIIL